MGYHHVEHANYVNRKFYGWTAKEFKKILDDLEMQMPSGHTVMTSSIGMPLKRFYRCLEIYS
jgi:hypothetical protein